MGIDGDHAVPLFRVRADHRAQEIRTLAAGTYLIQTLMGAVGAVSKIVARTGVRTLVASGTGTAAIGMLLLSRLSRLSPHSTYLTGVMLPMIVPSAGLGLTFVPATLSAVSGVKERDSGLVAGVSTTAIQLGGAIGLAVLASIAAATTAQRANPTSPQALIVGCTHAFLAGALIIALAAPIALALLRLRPTHDHPAVSDDSALDKGRETATSTRSATATS